MSANSSVSAPILIVGAGPVGLALAGDLATRGQAVTVLERSDGTIEQPRMDMVGVRTMEFCRRWGIVPNVEASAYNRDLAQDNVYVTSLTGYELGRERFPSMRQSKPPEQSPQKRERCPQDMFDPILAAMGAFVSARRPALSPPAHRLRTKRRRRHRARYRSGNGKIVRPRSAVSGRLRRCRQPHREANRGRHGRHAGPLANDEHHFPRAAIAFAARQRRSVPLHHL